MQIAACLSAQKSLTLSPMTPLLQKLLRINWWLVAAMYGLLIFGIFAIESAARHLPGGGAAFAESQKKWIMIGTVVYAAAALIDYRWFRWLGIPMYVAGVALCASIMNSDQDVHQVTILGLSGQPAQLAVVSGILLLSWLLQDLPRLGEKIPRIGWILSEPIFKVSLVALIVGIPFLVVIKMGDMGSAMVYIPVAIVALIVSGVPFRYLCFMTLIGVASVPPMYHIVLPKTSERGTARIELFLDMLHDRPVDLSGSGYAPHNIAVAIGHAGFSGIGHMATADLNSMHDRRLIPYRTAHNDFIFPVIAEEHGFRGAMLLITGFTALMVACLFIAASARDPMGQLLVSGIVALFFAHIFENIGMCIQLMPITGIPLPLISYSGTFVLACMFMLGLVQSVWIHRKPLRASTAAEPRNPQPSGMILSKDMR